MKTAVSRRAFLSRLAMMAGGATLAACAPTVKPQPTQAPTASQPTQAPAETQPTPTAVAQPATPAPQCDRPVKLRCAHSWPAVQWPRQVEFDNLFNKEHECIQMEGENIVWGDYVPKITAAAAAGSLPDIIYVQFSMAQRFIMDGITINHQPLLENDREFWGENGEDFVPVSLVTYKWQGDLYMVPFNEGPTNLLYYNKRLLDEAGVPYPNSDKEWTLDDLVEAAKELTRGEGENKIWGYDGMPDMWGELNADWLYLWDARHWHEPCENETSIDEDNAIQCLQWWLDRYHKDKIFPTPAERSTIQGNAFAAGRVAMTKGASWSNRTFMPALKEGYDVTHHCIGPNGKRSTSTMGSAYAISRDCKNIDAAWEYMRNYLSTEGQIFNFASIGVDPCRWSAWPAYFTSGSAPANAKVVTEAMEQYAVHDILDSPNGSEIYETCQPIWDRAMLGEISAREACLEIAAAVRPVMKQNEDWCQRRGA